MRKMLPLLVVGILVLSGLGAVALPSEEYELETLLVSFSRPVIVTEKEYVSINIDEANSFIMEQGKPMLPSYVHTFTFPFGTKIKSVTCMPTNIQTQIISKDVMPTPKAVLVGQTVAISQKEVVNYGTEPYPSNWFEYDVACGRYQGDLRIIVKIEVSPVRYHPVEKIIEWAKEVNIAIEYEPSVVQSSFRDQYELIVIGPDEFSDELAPLITHKIGRGVSAKFVGLNEVYSGPGRDNQEKIKYYIKDAVETWATSNVLLVGSSSKLPARETHIYVEYTDPPDDEIFVSDLYYADIYDGDNNFCSWDSNGNDVFGEYNWEGWLGDGKYDDVDLHPDVYLGRIPAINGGQVTTVVNKIKTYENGQAYKENWFTDLVVVGGDTSTDFETIEGEYINQIVMDMMGGFSGTKLWVTNGKLTGYVPKTGLKYIKDSISAGCGFVDFSGHGNTNVWATHPEGDEKTWVPTPYKVISSTDVGTLTNGNKLPIVAVEACSTSKFNKDDNTFNWAFLHNSGGGGIGSFGATALGWGYVGEGISYGLIGKMGLDTFRAFRYDDAMTFGEMWASALERYIKPNMEALDYKVVEEWEPFGDPTLQIAEDSTPPAKPSTPSGTTSGNTGQKYTYTTQTTDPNGDQVYYKWEWGDDTYSSWLGPYNSGETASAEKTWSSDGTYEIRVAAKDTHGKTSSWSNPLTVTMPRNRAINTLFQQFLEKFPILERLLLLLPIFNRLLNL